MKLTIKEYMEKYGIRSKQTVYNKIKSGEIKKIKVGTRIFILIDDKQNTDQEINSDIHEFFKNIKQNKEQTEAYVKELKEQIKDLRKDKESLSERLREANILNLNNVEVIKNLTKTVEMRNGIAKPKGQTWLSKFFKRNDEAEE